MQRVRLFLKSVAVAGSGLILIQAARGATETNRFSFNDYLLVPIRVHLLMGSPAVETTLTNGDITRILGKINRVWAQAGVHFHLESLVREPANVPEAPSEPSKRADHRELLALRPSQ